jgi:hypothetical protein
MARNHRVLSSTTFSGGAGWRHLVFNPAGSFFLTNRRPVRREARVARNVSARSPATCGATAGAATTSKVSGQVSVGFACSDLAHERMLSPEQWVRAFGENLRSNRTFVFLGRPAIARGRRDHRRAARRIRLTFETRARPVDQQSVTTLFESSEFWGIDSSLLHLALRGAASRTGVRRIPRR